MHLNKIGFIFDHDGVLADTEEINFIAWSELLNKHDNELTRDLYRSKIHGYSTLGAIDNIFGRLGINEKSEYQREKSLIYDGLVTKYLKPIDGVLDFIKNAKKLGIKISIGSAAKRNRIEYSIKKFRISNFVDSFISSDDVLKTKPDPEVYFKAIAKLELQPDKCIIFEDSSSGLIAANLSGAKAVFINSSKLDKNDVKQGFVLEAPNFLTISPEEVVKWI